MHAQSVPVFIMTILEFWLFRNQVENMVEKVVFLYLSEKTALSCTLKSADVKREVSSRHPCVLGDQLVLYFAPIAGFEKNQ